MSIQVKKESFAQICRIFGISQKRLAERIHVSESTLSLWLRDRIIYADTLVDICNELRLPLCHLFYEGGEEKQADTSLSELALPKEEYVPVSFDKSRMPEVIRKNMPYGMTKIDLIRLMGIGKTAFYAMLKDGEVKPDSRKSQLYIRIEYLLSLSEAMQMDIGEFFTGGFYPPKGKPEVEGGRWRTEMEQRISSLEGELRECRLTMQAMHHTIQQLVSSLERRPYSFNDEHSSGYHMPAGQVSNEPDTATSAVKSM